MTHSSFLGRCWVLRESDPQADLLDQLLVARGITSSQKEAFLRPDFTRDGHSPKLLKDLNKALERIETAIAKQERILICGDYDVDGVTASAILYRALQALGATVSARLPHRIRDGFGLNARVIHEAAELGVGLIITVDNGITAKTEVELANSLGITTIITDHHIPPAELPPAYAIVNPRQEDCEYPDTALSGATVAYKLATALLGKSAGESHQELLAELLALATIGTIADICPLIGENRALVTAGLRLVGQTKNSGLNRIIENAGIKNPISVEDIGFRIGPRLNAAGRLDDAMVAFQALTHPTHALQFADQLEELNRSRQRVSEDSVASALEQISTTTDDPILVASSPEWHAGIVGLIAGRIAEQYYRPVFIMAERDGQLTGSARCRIPEFNLTAALTEVSDLLTHFGGHRAAAGFTLPVDKKAEFVQRLRVIAERELAAAAAAPALEIETEVGEADLSLDFLHKLKQLEPHGADNPEPVLLWRAVNLSDLRAVGVGGKHLSLRVGKSRIKAVGFGLGEALTWLSGRTVADLACVLMLDEWQGRQSLQLRIIDLR